MRTKYFIFVFILIIASLKVYSQKLSVESKNVERGVISSLYLTLSDYNDISQIELRIKFNSYLLDIKSVKVVEGGIIQDVQLNYSINSADLVNSILTINSDRLISGGEQLCLIEFEALAGSDSVAYFTPIELILNGKLINAEFIAGKISMGIPIFPIEINSLSYIYPNPIVYQSYLDIEINQESEFELALYSYHGGIAAVYPNSKDDDEFYIWSESAGSKISLNKGEKLPIGSYKLYFTPQMLFLSSQAYYMVVKIGSEVFRRNLIIIK